MPTAFLFPGQGSYKAGALQPWDAHPACNVLNAINDGVGRDITTVCDDEHAGARTKDAQPAIMAASLVAYQALCEAGITADYVAGHSLGEYTAAIASGVFNVTDGARIVQTRADAMAVACATNPGTMAAIVKLDAATVHQLVDTIDGVVVANDNAEGQIVVAGDIDAVQQAREAARELGGRGLPLTVEGAFHSPAMAPAQTPLQTVIEATQTLPMQIPVISGAYARVCTDAADVCASLIDGLLMPVRWRELQHCLNTLKVDTIVEVGPGGVLAAMAKRAFTDVAVFSVANPKDVNTLVAHAKERP